MKRTDLRARAADRAVEGEREIGAIDEEVEKAVDIERGRGSVERRDQRDDRVAIVDPRGVHRGGLCWIVGGARWARNPEGNR
ncbi:MAG TPA: hypothetical protein VLU54_12565 [Casimicrobiaceae bacterium]|nr:hypothetical protein [Casimicrobiaceae bacterium]